MTTPAPGIYDDVPFSEYQSWAALNASTLKIGEESMLAMRWQREHQTEPTPAMILGSAGHTCCLEPDLFPMRYVLWQGDRRGKQFTAFKEANQHKTILRESDYATCLAMRDAVNAHPVASTLLKHYKTANEPQFEASILWHANDLEHKARLDVLSPECIVDLKTTRSVNPRSFGTSAFRMGYHIQIATYVEAVEAIGRGTLPFAIIAVQNAAPFDVVVFNVPDELVTLGRHARSQLIERYKWCVKHDTWPGVSADMLDLEFPGFAYPDGDVDITIGGESAFD